MKFQAEACRTQLLHFFSKIRIADKICLYCFLCLSASLPVCFFLTPSFSSYEVIYNRSQINEKNSHVGQNQQSKLTTTIKIFLSSLMISSLGLQYDSSVVLNCLSVSRAWDLSPVLFRLHRFFPGFLVSIYNRICPSSYPKYYQLELKISSSLAPVGTVKWFSKWEHRS